MPQPMLLKRSLAPFAQAKYLVRALGFEILNTFLRPLTAAETVKPVLRRSRWIALSRCIIHLLPCGVFSLLLYLNFNAIYIGTGFAFEKPDALYLACFQVAAKLLELICAASLTTVLLHVLRLELTNDGVPLGFVGSGVFFTQATCLWSSEMVAGAIYCGKSWKRLRLFLLIGSATCIAVLIAPSSAVLLQPRLQNVPAGGTDYFLPATHDELWPSVVDGLDELPECFSGFNRRRILCASGGFESLRAYFQNYNSSLDVTQGTVEPRPIIVTSPTAKIPRLLNGGNIYGFARETSIYQANAITTIIQQSLTQDWYHIAQAQKKQRISARQEYKYAVEYISSTDTTHPVVGVRCAKAQNISTDSFSVNFPVKLWNPRDLTTIQEGSGEWDTTELPINISALGLKSSDQLQANWTFLPVDQFGPVSGGVYFQFPWEPISKSRAVVGCSISASWIYINVASDSISGDAAWSMNVPLGPLPNITTALNASSPQAINYRRLITLKEHWYQSLTPITPSETGQNQSYPLNTLQQLFADVGPTELIAQRTEPQPIYEPSTDTCIWANPNSNTTDVDRLNSVTCGSGSKHQLLEVILASTFANGLSRYGSRRAFDLPSSIAARSNPFLWTLKPPPEAPGYSQSLLSIKPKHNAVLPAPEGSNFVNQTMLCEVFGYSWYTSSATDKLAISIVVAYMLIAGLYTIWVLVVTGVTGCSWDTVTEMLALALQSPVPDVLKGVGAGVERFGTYKHLVRLRAIREGKGGREEAEKLVLTVGDGDVSVDGEMMDQGSVEDGMAGEGELRCRRVVVGEEYL